MFRYRLLSACVMIFLVMLALFMLSGVHFSIAVTCLMAVAAWEWTGLCEMTALLSRSLFVFVILIVSLSAGFFPQMTIYFMLLSLFFWGWGFSGLRAYNKGVVPWGLQCRWCRMLFGVVLLVSGWLSFVWLRVHSRLGAEIFVYVLLLVSATDSGAYLFGKWLGRHSFAHRVSPNKTWEGFWGGLFTAGIVMILGACFFNLPLTEWIGWGLLSCVVSLAAVYGDLFMSMLKRIAGVKDSGSIIPGHGGVLDRLDSVLPAILLFTLGLIFMNLSLY